MDAGFGFGLHLDHTLFLHFDEITLRTEVALHGRQVLGVHHLDGLLLVSVCLELASLFAQVYHGFAQLCNFLQLGFVGRGQFHAVNPLLQLGYLRAGGSNSILERISRIVPRRNQDGLDAC